MALEALKMSDHDGEILRGSPEKKKQNPDRSADGTTFTLKELQRMSSDQIERLILPENQ